MQRLILSLLICLGFVLPATAQAWWQDDWHYRKQIAVDTTPQGAAINHAHQRVETFDLVVEHGFVIRRDKAQIGAVLFHAVEGEVAGVQAHQ